MAKDLYVSALLDVYGRFLSEKQCAFTEYYFNDDLSLSEIAENEGITRQGARDIITRAQKQLQKFEEECGYCQKFLRLKKLAEQDITDNIGEIKEIIDNL